MQTKIRAKKWRISLSAVLGLLALTPVALAQTRFLVSVNTSSLNTTVGNLDFQFNPEGADAQATTLAISQFTTDGILTGTAVNTGDAFNALPGQLLLDNGTVYNDVFQGITYGSSLSFVATFYGAALTPPAGVTSGSAFSFSLYDNAAPPNALLTTNPDGSAAQIAIGTDGNITYAVFPANQGGPSAVSITSAPIPEASTEVSLSLLAMGLCVFAIGTRRQNRSSIR